MVKEVQIPSLGFIQRSNGLLGIGQQQTWERFEPIIVERQSECKIQGICHEVHAISRVIPYLAQLLNNPSMSKE